VNKSPRDDVELCSSSIQRRELLRVRIALHSRDRKFEDKRDASILNARKGD
jgi:hypothetical protein